MYCQDNSLVGMSVDKLPCISNLLRISELDIVGNDINFVCFFVANQIGENASQDRLHAARDNNDGDIMLFRVDVKVFEARIEGNV